MVNALESSLLAPFVEGELTVRTAETINHARPLSPGGRYLPEDLLQEFGL